jgi:hypothetical protein
LAGPFFLAAEAAEVSAWLLRLKYAAARTARALINTRRLANTGGCDAICDDAAIYYADLRGERRLRVLANQRRYLVIRLHLIFGDVDLGQFVFQFGNPHLESLGRAGCCMFRHAVLLFAYRIFDTGPRSAFLDRISLFGILCAHNIHPSIVAGFPCLFFAKIADFGP